MLRVPNSDTPELLADWLEAMLLVGAGGGRVADSDVQDLIAEKGFDEELTLELILQQVHQRGGVLGDKYPVVRDARAFRLRNEWSNQLAYSYLLLISLNQSYPELTHGAGANSPAADFELLTANALAMFLGASSIRMGASRRHPVPAAFPAALQYLSQAIGEPLHGSGELERQNSGDDGLDVWGFKLFDDARPSSLSVLVQCAIGIDWRDKRSELDLKLWHRHVDYFTEPIKAFAVPFQIGHDSWRETATRGGLILDRLRIAKWANADFLDQAFLAGIRAWCETRITRTVAAIAA